MSFVKLGGSAAAAIVALSLHKGEVKWTTETLQSLLSTQKYPVFEIYILYEPKTKIDSWRN